MAQLQAEEIADFMEFRVQQDIKRDGSEDIQLKKKCCV